VGLILETSGGDVQPGVLRVLLAAASALEALGATVTPVSLPSFALGLPAYYIIAPAEASSNLARYDGLRYGALEQRESLKATMEATRAAGFGEEVKRRILTGTYTLSAGYVDAYYNRAQRVRELVRSEMVGALSGACDLFLSPTTPSTAYRLGEKLGDGGEDGGRGALEMYLGDLMTVNVNLAGLPALSLPFGFAPPAEQDVPGAAGGEMLPVGVQLIGKPFGEAELLRVAHVLEVTSPALGGPPGYDSPV
jgi:aspartyl-tRNA(Asn)/glutamyl-tRNA(Gln) amidotransferase subunit A